MMADVCLIHMPFSLLGNPSMALSVLKGEAAVAGLHTTIYYGNLRLAKKMGLENYQKFMKAMDSFSLFGELLFSRYVGFSVYRDSDAYFAYVRKQLDLSNEALKALYENCCRQYEFADFFIDEFLDEMVETILAENPKIVGCDITYQQQNAALALFRRIKARAPQVVTVLGGNSCNGSSGQAIVDYQADVDFVFSGEADDLFPNFCRAVLNGAAKSLVHRQFPSALIAGGRQVSWARLSLEDATIPDFTDYFRELKTLQFSAHIKPCLIVEGSRGCWWGAKKRCTFCGIHTSEETLQYRQKSSKQIMTELSYQYDQYGIDAFVFTDCILSYQHIHELLPLLKSSPHVFSLFGEVKSNLAKDDIIALYEAGFIFLQPGIESLQDDLLRLMNKGNRAIKHLEFLKHCRYAGIRLVWNLLYDMPGDQSAWYEQIYDLIPSITHLFPPTSLNKIIYQRNSLYCQDSQRYGLKVEPVELYHYTGLDCDDFIERSAEFYAAQPLQENMDRENKEKVVGKLITRIQEWKTIFAEGFGDRLNMSVYDDRIEISDLRKATHHTLYTLVGLEREIYRLADTAVLIHTVCERLADRYEAKEIHQAILKLLADKLLVCIGSEILALAVAFPAKPYIVVHTLPCGRICF